MAYPEFIEDMLDDLCRSDLALQRRVKTSISSTMGSIELAARRGEQTGVWKAYNYLRTTDPEIANKILKEFNMQPDGSI